MAKSTISITYIGAEHRVEKAQESDKDANQKAMAKEKAKEEAKAQGEADEAAPSVQQAWDDTAVDPTGTQSADPLASMGLVSEDGVTMKDVEENLSAEEVVKKLPGPFKKKRIRSSAKDIHKKKPRGDSRCS